MAGYLNNPDSVPLDSINLTFEALYSVERAAALQVEVSNHELNSKSYTPEQRILQQEEKDVAKTTIAKARHAREVLRNRYLQAEFDKSGLSPFKISPEDGNALDATAPFKIGVSLSLFTRSPDPNTAAFERTQDINAFARSSDLNAFSFSGAISTANKYVKALEEIYKHVQAIIAVAGPLVGLKPLASQKTAAFDRKTRNPARAGTGPIQFYEPLFTDEALAYVLMQGDAPEKDNIKALRDISLIHFFRRKENCCIQEYTAQKTGFVNCTSQRQEGIASMVVGGADEPNEVSLWENNSKLVWYMIDETFQTQEQFTAVETSMYASTAAWNKISPGGVKFARAEKKKDAVFNVKFVKGGGDKEAVAFFPTEYIPGQSAVHIFENALKPESLAYLSNVLCHELGHVMGFRHEFALEQERSHQAGDADGISDPHSVMSYEYPPLITLTDVESSRRVYKKFMPGSILKLNDGRGYFNDFLVKRVSTSVAAS